MCWRLGEPFTAVLKKKKKKKSAVAPDQPQTDQVQGALIRRPVTKKHALYAHLEDRGTAAGKRLILKTSFTHLCPKHFTVQTEITHQCVNDLKTSNTSA